MSVAPHPTSEHRTPPILSVESAAVALDGATLLPPTSLQAYAGQCLAVLGPNGAGKTTLLRVLAGRLRPTSGGVRSEVVGLRGRRGFDERDRRLRREIAALIEPPTLYPDLTIRDQLALIEALWEGSPGEREAPWPGLGPEALEVFGIAALADRFPNELSSGQRQLVSLSVTLARPCSVLLLDEPEQRLDPDRRALVAETMLAVRRRGTAVIFASHDRQLVDRVSDGEVRVGE